MFQKAQLKLTFYYSALFLALFWSFSFGLYSWMNRSFGEGYISQVQERQGQLSDEKGLQIDRNAINGNNANVVIIAGDVALDELLKTLIFLNLGLLFVVPVTSWFLAKLTLSPIKKAHDQQKQFTQDASHEMRTPLSIMSGEIEIALHKKRSVSEYQKILSSTKEETQRLSKLVENLLFLASSDQNKTISLKHVDLTDLINEVASSLEPKYKAKKIIVNLNTDHVNSPVVLGNSDFLRQLFYNLLDNAITYTHFKGKVSITIRESKKSIFVDIKDSGIGISSDHLKKITERFYRVDRSRSKTKGYGLGLSIASEILAKHKGKLIIDSELNKGSTFTIELPQT